MFIALSTPLMFKMNPLNGIPPVNSPGRKLITIDVVGVTETMVKFIGASGVSPTITNPEIIDDSPAMFSAVTATA